MTLISRKSEDREHAEIRRNTQAKTLVPTETYQIASTARSYRNISDREHSSLLQKYIRSRAQLAPTGIYLDWTFVLSGELNDRIFGLLSLFIFFEKCYNFTINVGRRVQRVFRLPTYRFLTKPVSRIRYNKGEVMRKTVLLHFYLPIMLLFINLRTGDPRIYVGEESPSSCIRP